jgi:hypothetical protein
MNEERLRTINKILEDKSKHRLRETYFKKNHIDIYNKIISFIDLDITFKEKLWYWVSDINKEFKCKTCGKNKTTFNKNWLDGYRDYCSHKCSAANKTTKEKRKDTVKEKYGVDNVAKNTDIKEKTKETNLERYGTESTFQNEEVREKWRINMIEKYGVDHYFKTDEFKEKCKQHYYEKWGVEHQSQIEEIQEKIKKTNLERHGVETYLNTDHARSSHKSYNKSKAETEIYDWLKNHTNNIITSDKKVILPKELDIYLPDHNLAIEYNGLYWHSEFQKDKKYHLNKTKDCESKAIDLVHIFEDDWKYKKDIVKSIILNKIGKIPNKIFARKCEIREVPTKIVRTFLNKNHIQGFSKSKYKLGLYYNDELISLMTFGYRKTNAKKEFELIRFCNKINTSVIGAASKLFKHFIKNYIKNIQTDTILSYADISMFNGSLYKSLGFDFIHRSEPNYFWAIGKIREHRWKYNKQNLIKEGFNPGLTEVEIMHSRGYYRIYGCGQDRYEYKL